MPWRHLMIFQEASKLNNSPAQTIQQTQEDDIGRTHGQVVLIGGPKTKEGHDAADKRGKY